MCKIPFFPQNYVYDLTFMCTIPFFAQNYVYDLIFMYTIPIFSAKWLYLSGTWGGGSTFPENTLFPKKVVPLFAPHSTFSNTPPQNILKKKRG